MYSTSTRTPIRRCRRYPRAGPRQAGTRPHPLSCPATPSIGTPAKAAPVRTTRRPRYCSYLPHAAAAHPPHLSDPPSHFTAATLLYWLGRRPPPLPPIFRRYLPHLARLASAGASRHRASQPANPSTDRLPSSPFIIAFIPTLFFFFLFRLLLRLAPRSSLLAAPPSAVPEASSCASPPSRSPRPPFLRLARRPSAAFRRPRARQSRSSPSVWSSVHLVPAFPVTLMRCPTR
ncbi:hypothetical protein CDD83_8220 [Cordyceps sp. RAO-2017]|nr:hypothetical protein CDD83_8220 [Cordyceps sp. RAO-2017]